MTLWLLHNSCSLLTTDATQVLPPSTDTVPADYYYDLLEIPSLLPSNFGRHIESRQDWYFAVGPLVSSLAIHRYTEYTLMLFNLSISGHPMQPLTLSYQLLISRLLLISSGLLHKKPQLGHPSSAVHQPSFPTPILNYSRFNFLSLLSISSLIRRE